MERKIISGKRSGFESRVAYPVKGSAVMNAVPVEQDFSNEYTEEQLMHLAKRFHNTKRTYLLVDPLQGKHIPVSPTDCLSMLRTLGCRLHAEFPKARLVVGFAETATAIGAVVAECMGEDCAYIQTTREEVPEVSDWIEFQEEHCHATEQKLSAQGFAAALYNTDTVIFVDDELSTGKTLVNMIEQLRKAFPILSRKVIVAASVINRMSDENIQRLADHGMVCRQLLKIDNIDYTDTVNSYAITGAAELPEFDDTDDVIKSAYLLKDEGEHSPRTGVVIGEYIDSILARHSFITAADSSMIPAGRNIVVLGTEECMYPGLLIAERLEQSGAYDSVKFHATTRSPIGICTDEGYPIFNGYKLQSFYEKGRQTHLYDLDKYDSALIITDSAPQNMDAVAELEGLLRYYGCREMIVERI
ncbi:phosphoribosyltransferase domain-containing protein [Ruminococcus sp.]|uniref:phosphoribosyltransferase domain-containing protein n=1 Tax=Ruminococcus sp. TaxID=41978 RepID=UPI002600C221|nr:phosphoribosyltransferase domain-containing protein [Ruminococcus sp.]MBQ8967906.1 phosphoribosyltransferase domain-containing protein [Ruminococcus sp.]